MIPLLDLYESMNADAEKNIERLETEDRLVFDGTAEETIAALRNALVQIDEATRKARLY